jgi:hypothetical protein
MPVNISCPQLLDAAARARLHRAVEATVRRWRPGFERWQLRDLAISGPRFRRVLTLNGPLDDLPGLVTAYVDAVLADA